MENGIIIASRRENQSLIYYLGQKRYFQSLMILLNLGRLPANHSVLPIRKHVDMRGAWLLLSSSHDIDGRLKPLDESISIDKSWKSSWGLVSHRKIISRTYEGFARDVSWRMQVKARSRQIMSRFKVEMGIDFSYFPPFADTLLHHQTRWNESDSGDLCHLLYGDCCCYCGISSYSSISPYSGNRFAGDKLSTAAVKFVDR